MTGVRFKHMSATRQLAVGRAYPALMPGLMLKGLEPDNAVALAHNAAFLYYALETDPPLGSPDKVLERFSLGEIARLCEKYAEWADSEREILPSVMESDQPESAAGVPEGASPSGEDDGGEEVAT